MDFDQSVALQPWFGHTTVTNDHLTYTKGREITFLVMILLEPQIDYTWPMPKNIVVSKVAYLLRYQKTLVSVDYNIPQVN